MKGIHDPNLLKFYTCELFSFLFFFFLRDTVYFILRCIRTASHPLQSPPSYLLFAITSTIGVGTPLSTLAQRRVLLSFHFDLSLVSMKDS